MKEDGEEKDVDKLLKKVELEKVSVETEMEFSIVLLTITENASTATTT